LRPKGIGKSQCAEARLVLILLEPFGNAWGVTDASLKELFSMGLDFCRDCNLTFGHSAVS
jgi:hypothetical protein